jgi:uncharacterized SAM-binding protein YcdF (DUF218 family)
MNKNQQREKLKREFSELKDLPNPKPKTDWDLIWVLSGDQLDIKKNYKNQRNETRERFETGINLAKEITSRRGGIKPKIYFSGYNNHNRLMSNYVKQSYFQKKYNFPDENIIIRPKENNLHTDSQFQNFPEELILKYRIIVIVTDAYHIPRCRRYLKKYPEKFPTGKFIFYPSQPVILDEKPVNLEIEKILKYTENKILPELF